MAAAKRTKKTIPMNLTLVEVERVRDDETTTAPKPKSRRKGPRVARDAEDAHVVNNNESAAHDAPVATVKGKAKKTQKKAEAPTGHDAESLPPEVDLPETTAAKTVTIPSGTTLSGLRELYLAHLAQIGKTPATVASYGIDLGVAIAFFGADASVADLTPDDVQRYYDCPAVTRTRTGKEKSPVTTAKIRRVLRMALAWAGCDAQPIPMP